ncbi:MAG TPA: formylglycine-generating enzyme family protein, partial [Opitutus sp.]|nr:formylglycine-generating enzyme family protein [Opitutus sp.]
FEIEGLQRVAIEGNVDYPMRRLSQLLAAHPDDARLVRFQTQLMDLRAHRLGAAATGAPPPPPARGPLAAPPPIAGHEARSGQDFTTDTAEIPMIWIAPGTFLMSSTHGTDDDTQVTLTHGYWIGRTELTQAQWRELMDNISVPSLFKGSDRPVERVSWVLATEFCRKLDEREHAAGRVPAGYEYTLPTEAQWEYACRAGTTGSFAGDIDEMGWTVANSGGQTHPVAQKRPNAWGLYDMHGNVGEWCVDGLHGYPGGAVNDLRGDYSGPSAGTFRIVRGGSWGANLGECRSGFRSWAALGANYASVGFRVALAPVRDPARADPAVGGATAK